MSIECNQKLLNVYFVVKVLFCRLFSELTDPTINPCYRLSNLKSNKNGQRQLLQCWRLCSFEIMSIECIQNTAKCIFRGKLFNFPPPLKFYYLPIDDHSYHWSIFPSHHIMISHSRYNAKCYIVSKSWTLFAIKNC